VAAEVAPVSRDHRPTQRRWWPRPLPPAAKKAQFYQQLGRQIAGGVALDDALAILIPIAGRRSPLGVAISGLRRSLSAGVPLASAMAQQAPAFDVVEVTLVDVASHTGGLPAVCERLQRRAEASAEVAAGLRRALAYPLLVILASWLLLPLPLLLTAGPQAFLADVGARLAGAGAVAAVLAWGLPHLWTMQGVRTRLLQLWAAMPGLRIWADHRRLALVLGTLAPAVEAGVPLPRALELAGTSSGEADLPAQMQRLIEALRSGAPLHQVLARLPGVDEEMAGLVAAGERSGHLVEALTEQAAHRQQVWHRDLRWLGRGVQVAITLAALAWAAVGVAEQMQRAMDPFQGGEGQQLQKEFDSLMRQMPRDSQRPELDELRSK
jgi:type II secretory pathway component PulF